VSFGVLSPDFLRERTYAQAPENYTPTLTAVQQARKKLCTSLKNIISSCKSAQGYLQEVFQENCYYKNITRFSWMLIQTQILIF
jgi:hypothetical protein